MFKTFKFPLLLVAFSLLALQSCGGDDSNSITSTQLSQEASCQEIASALCEQICSCGDECSTEENGTVFTFDGEGDCSSLYTVSCLANPSGFVSNKGSCINDINDGLTCDNDHLNLTSSCQ